MNIEQPIKPMRLNTYTKYISKFDFLDKTLNKHFKLEKIILQGQFPIQNKIVALSTVILLEVLVGQRLFLTNFCKTSFLKKEIYKISLNHRKLFLLLDIFLNSLFLYNTFSQEFNIKNHRVVLYIKKRDPILYILFSEKLFNKLNLSIPILNCSLEFIYYKQK